MINDEYRYWVAFSAFEGIGPVRFKLLKEYFGSAKSAYLADSDKLLSIGLTKNIVDKFVVFRKSFNVDLYYLRLAKLGIAPIVYEQQEYPTLLKQTVNPPIVLYVKSNDPKDINQLFSLPSLAVVGTRKVTSYGRQVTQMIVADLVRNGFCVVSGLALGVDGVAHSSVIENQGRTIAVMGCGLDKIYPSSHVRLANQIIESGGLWVSEYPLDSRAFPGNFPNRNRIISGLCLGVIVTEAAEDSGSLITARCATEQGREVFAIPGPITSQVSGGTTLLLKQGAIPVSGVDDILDNLPGFKKTKVKTDITGQIGNLSEDELRIVDLLKNGDLSLDEICRVVCFSTDVIASTLSVLEIKGIIINDSGKYFLRR